MLQELVEYTQTFGFKEEGYARIVSARRSEDDLDLELQIEFEIYGDPVQTWELLCKTERESRISFQWISPFEILDDHVLLWPYNETHQALWLSSTGLDVPTTLCRLKQVHFDMVEDWFPFHRFFNSSADLPDLLSGGAGLIASGPESLLRAYRTVLEEKGFRTSITQRGPDSSQEKASRFMALLLGDSYVIASAFEARKIPTKPRGQNVLESR